jgi:hypothetical protein
MHLEKFLHSKTGKVLVSILLGLGLASLLKTTCKDKNCIIVHGAPVGTIRDTVYQAPGYEGCIRYDIIPVKCDKSKKIYQTS